MGSEISITGKWIATKKSGFFRKSAEYKEMLKEWDSIHQEAKMHEGMLSTEINPAIGQDAVLIRTYSKFMNLPATYTGQGSHYTQGRWHNERRNYSS